MIIANEPAERRRKEGTIQASEKTCYIVVFNQSGGGTS